MTAVAGWRAGLGVAAVNVGALAVLVASAQQAARHDVVTAQYGWLSVAVTAAIAALVADGAVLLFHRRRLAVTHRALELAAAVAPSTADHVGPLVALPSGTRYHRPDCVLVSGRDLSEAARSDHETAGRRACRACLP